MNTSVVLAPRANRPAPSAGGRSSIRPGLANGCCRAIAAAVLLAAVALVPVRAAAQGRLDATYSAHLGGVPVGTGGLTVEVGKRAYQASGNGHVGGLMRILATYAGSVTAHGQATRDRLTPDIYQASVNSGQFDYDVRMVLQAGNVKELIAEPPLVPSPDRIPVTDSDRRGVLDPATAVIMPVPGVGNVVGPAACARTIPIFDGHQRFDLALGFKRIETVRAEVGYQGPVAVCSLGYQPIAGHRPSRFAVRYLQAQRDMEIWLAPIAGTRLLAPFRVVVPTLVGDAVIEATQFVTTAATPPRQPKGAARRPGPLPATGTAPDHHRAASATGMPTATRSDP